MCGGTVRPIAAALDQVGLSTRVRGNPAQNSISLSWQRSIHACAGEPLLSPFRPPGDRVYPRVCGGTFPYESKDEALKGLSPRVRGNPSVQGDTLCNMRSIPACAGEPIPAPAHHPAPRVYPRVCGGTARPRWWHTRAGGLSPRVRGNPGERQAGHEAIGSIPACAGEPLVRTQIPQLVQVYPRVCGGTRLYQGPEAGERGLSPRVRGNPCAIGNVE